MWGLPFSFFTATHMVTPVLGSQIRTNQLLGVTLVRTLFYAITSSTLTFFKFFYHLPSLTGALYFKAMLNAESSYATRAFWALVPLFCMALFISNPVGSQAWPYSLYWLIPAMIALLPARTTFLSALGSTFTTHAIGSVLFLFCTPMTPAFWLALMPVVFFERICFALGITTLYYLVTYCKQVVVWGNFRLLRA